MRKNEKPQSDGFSYLNNQNQKKKKNNFKMNFDFSMKNPPI